MPNVLHCSDHSPRFRDPGFRVRGPCQPSEVPRGGCLRHDRLWMRGPKCRVARASIWGGGLSLHHEPRQPHRRRLSNATLTPSPPPALCQNDSRESYLITEVFVSDLRGADSVAVDDIGHWRAPEGPASRRCNCPFHWWFLKLAASPLQDKTSNARQSAL